MDQNYLQIPFTCTGKVRTKHSFELVWLKAVSPLGLQAKYIKALPVKCESLDKVHNHSRQQCRL